MTNPKINSILDEGNRLFLEGKFTYHDPVNLMGSGTEFT